jgi:antitoxin component of RelBE/YafQ-DinJ toxin-antitoxin module
VKFDEVVRARVEAQLAKEFREIAAECGQENSDAMREALRNWVRSKRRKLKVGGGK